VGWCGVWGGGGGGGGGGGTLGAGVQGGGRGRPRPKSVCTHTEVLAASRGGVMVSPDNLSARELEKFTRKLVMVRFLGGGGGARHWCA
jgi:hypothetical protein